MNKRIRTARPIFDYENYREFLRDYYLTAKAQDKKFSFRFFSRQAGFASSGAILKVMNGKTNLSLEGIEKVARALQLNREEAAFFSALVNFNQSTTPGAKEKAAEALFKFREFRKIRPLREPQFRYFSQWYYPVIRELVSDPDFSEDPAWIARRLKPAISSQEAQRALAELIQLEILVRDPDGKLVPAEKHITSGDEVAFSGAAKCHRQFLERASESIDRFPRDQRDISAMTLGVTRDQAAEIKKRVQEFRKEIAQLISATEQGPSIETIYLLNIQLFPVVEPAKKSDPAKESA